MVKKNEFITVLLNVAKQLQSGEYSFYFTTTLPQNVNLEGCWECALVEIIYPNSWFNVTTADSLIEFLDIEKTLSNKIKIPRGRYETADELINILNSSIMYVARREKTAYNSYLAFSYVAAKRTIQLRIDRSQN